MGRGGMPVTSCKHATRLWERHPHRYLAGYDLQGSLPPEFSTLKSLANL